MITESFKLYILHMIGIFYDIGFKMGVDPSCLPNGKDLCKENEKITCASKCVQSIHRDHPRDHCN